MRKFSIAIVAALMLSLFGFSGPEKAKADTVIAPPCNFSSQTLLGSNYLAQTFVPGVDNIDNVGILVGNFSASSVKFNLMLTGPNGQVLATRPTSLSGNFAWPYRYIDPQFSIPSTRTGTYVIWVYPYTGYENNELYVKGSAFSDESCYPNGGAYQNIFTNLHRDFSFVVFGHNNDASAPEVVEAPADQQPPVDNQSLPAADQPSGTSSDTATTNATEKSSNSPKDLTAKWDENANAVNLSWSVSSLSGLSGYEIYKTNSTENTFSKLGTTTKDVLSYQDKDVKYGESYLYYVVGVAGTAVSDSSNTVSFLVDDQGIKPSTPLPGEQNESFWQKVGNNIVNNQVYLLGASALLLTLLLILEVIERIRKRSQKNRL